MRSEVFFAVYIAGGVFFVVAWTRMMRTIHRAPMPPSWTEEDRERLEKKRNRDGWSGLMLSIPDTGMLVLAAILWPLGVFAMFLGPDPRRNEAAPWLRRGKGYLMLMGRLPD